MINNSVKRRIGIIGIIQFYCCIPLWFFFFQYDSVILNGIFNIRRQGTDWYLSVLCLSSRVTLKPFTYNSSIIVIKAVVQAFFGVCDHPDIACKICAHVCFSREGKNFDRLLKKLTPKHSVTSTVNFRELYRDSPTVSYISLLSFLIDHRYLLYSFNEAQ